MYQVNVIHGGDVAIDATMFGTPSPALRDYFRDNINRLYDTASHIGGSFVNTVTSIYNRYSSDEAIERAKRVLYSTGQYINESVIVPVRYEDLPKANLIMQRYIMSHPEMDALYQKNKCHGYMGTYIDPEPGVAGKERIDYMNVMDGVLQFESNDDEEKALGYLEYYSHAGDNIDDISIYEQASILETWEEVAYAIARGLDPSDPDETMS